MSYPHVKEIMTCAPVIPVLVIDDLETAVPLAKALVAGGLKTLEITLRTPVALEAVTLIKKALPEAYVGVGTVLTPQQLKASEEAGAVFAVTPGMTEGLHKAAQQTDLPVLPGAGTASEIMQLLEWGYGYQKFFPAKINGGVPALKAFGGPLPEVKFCPTGGISESDYKEYLALPNVLCVGGSWVSPKDKIQASDWAGVEALARAACQL